MLCSVVVGVLDIHPDSEGNREEEIWGGGGGLPMGRREWKRDVPTHPVRGAKIIATTLGLYSMKMKDREVFLREANQLRRKVLGQSHGCMRKD